jgi:hypothetical protein
MTDPQAPRRIKLPSLERLARRIKLPSFKRLKSPAGASTAVLVATGALAVLYLGYDIAKDRISPCETIFRQTTMGLSTNISFLRTEAQLQLGRETVTELDERAQMAALNLKTCCTVLDAGRVNPEQFLQCKAKARAYDHEIGDLVTLVKTAVAEAVTSANAKPSSPQPNTGKGPPITTASISDAAKGAANPAIQAKIKAARKTSREFNQEIVEVRRKQAIETLKALPPKHIEIVAQEQEPNDAILTTNVIELDKWVTGSIGSGKDADFYSFTTPPTHRDWIRVEVQNRSTTLEPQIQLFDTEKTHLASAKKTTVGADLKYAFVAGPDTRYTLRVSNYYGKSKGVYALRVAPAKAYDSLEPNQTILDAKPIKLANPVAAKIMDGNDHDYFSFPVSDGEQTLRIKLENQSTTLHPEIAIYDGNKTGRGAQKNTTPGGELNYTLKTKGPATYHARVRDYYHTGTGEYVLTISEEK